MNLRIERTATSAQFTFGYISMDGEFLAYTQELPVAQYAQPDGESALDEGEYALRITTSPCSGNPCIKIIGPSARRNTAIRCVAPVGQNNNSITLSNCSRSPDGSLTSIPTYHPWAKLLNRLAQAERFGESCKLVIN